MAPRTHRRRAGNYLIMREFDNLSSRQIAEMCGVSDKTVAARRSATCGNSAPETRTGRDGKEYPATHPQDQPTEQRPPMEGEMPIAKHTLAPAGH